MFEQECRTCPCGGPLYVLFAGRNVTQYTPPRMINSAPHHTGACNSARTVLGGFDHSVNPVKKIRTP